MKRFLSLVLVAGAAQVHATNQSSVIDAPVVDVQPIVEVYTQRIPHESCREERVRVVERGARRSATPTLVGAVLGGTVGSVLGRNSSRRDVIGGAGAILGASVGYDRSRRQAVNSSYYVTENVCTTEYELRERERTSGYRVSYRYGGGIYETRTDYDPGSTIAVRVKLEPLP
ncbi:MAG: glycine zipper 2TM domain-containing protein [Congregibacter sp.]